MAPNLRFQNKGKLKEHLHRNAGQSAAARRTKKLLAKSNWFRQTAGDTDDGEDGQEGVADRRGGNTRG